MEMRNTQYNKKNKLGNLFEGSILLYCYLTARDDHRLLEPVNVGGGVGLDLASDLVVCVHSGELLLGRV